jgi:hypothetical protein
MRRVFFMALAAAAVLFVVSPGAVLANWGEHHESYSGEEMKSGDTKTMESVPQSSSTTETYMYQGSEEAGALPSDLSNPPEIRSGRDEGSVEGSEGRDFRGDIDAGP